MKSQPNELRKMRTLCGYSEKQVADLIGVKDIETITRWEKGYSKPSTLRLFKLCALYKVLAARLYPQLYEKIAQDMHTKLNDQKTKTQQLTKQKGKIA